MEKIKKIVCFFLIVFAFLNIRAQDYQISFSGTGAASSVDSVRVENLTQGITKYLKGYDVLQLSSTVGLNELKPVTGNAVYIFPNPMNGSCSVDFDAAVEGKVTVELFTMSGKQIFQRQESVTKGLQTYNLNGIGSGIYMLKIASDNYSYTSKIVSINATNGKIELKHSTATSLANTKNNDSNLGSLKSLISENSIRNMQYNTGDQLRLTGKSGIYSLVIMLIPTQSQNVLFDFVACSDADGNNYTVVKIDKQIWMAENLKTSKYNDSTIIPNVTDPTVWTALTTPAHCWYNNDSVGFKASGYGALYNWYAVNTGNLCPANWHVPDDSEWTILTNYLGGETVAGGKLKETGANHWVATSAGCTNSSGFTAFGAGWRDLYSFYYGGYGGIWWSSGEADTANAWYRGMYYYYNSVENKNGSKVKGFSVRCLKD